MMKEAVNLHSCNFHLGKVVSFLAPPFVASTIFQIMRSCLVIVLLLLPRAFQAVAAAASDNAGSPTKMYSSKSQSFLSVTAERNGWKRPHFALTHLSLEDLYGTVGASDNALSANAHRRALQQTQILTPFTPLRFYFDTRIIESVRGTGNNDAKIDRILNEILPAAAAKWSAHLSVQTLLSSIPVNRDSCFGEFSGFLEEEIFIEDADIVVLVGGDPMNVCKEGVLAYAAPCQLEPITDRPIVALMNFCLDQIPTEGNEIFGSYPNVNGVDLSDAFSSRTGATFREEHMSVSLDEITIHELAHAMGQSSQLFVYFRDENGEPRTPRDSDGLPIAIERRCLDGSMASGALPSTDTVQEVETADGRIEQYLVTPRVQAIARNHFGCQSLLGARLANDIDMCVGTHWHERHYFSHLLSPVVSDSSETSLSLLTLAMMEDSGWYQVDYRGGSQPGFGIDAGCSFVEENCIDGNTDAVAEWVVNEFCDSPITFVDSAPNARTLNHMYCDPAHTSWTICDLGRLTDFDGRTYFSDDLLGPLIFDQADACPIPHIGLGRNCQLEDLSYTPFYPGESVGGQNSRCINAYYEDESTGTQVFRPACMSAKCLPESKSILIGDLTCSSDGQIIPIPSNPGSFLICPRLATICPEMFVCREGCFGRGECVQADSGTGISIPTCRCFDETNTDLLCRSPAFVSPTTEPTMRPVSAPTTSSTKLPSTLVPASVPTTSISSPPRPEQFTDGPALDSPVNTPTTSSSRPRGSYYSTTMVCGFLFLAFSTR